MTDRTIERDDADNRDETITEQAHQAKESTWAHASARVGLGSRALVYGLFTVLVVQIAVRGRSATGSDTDQSSGRSGAGTVLLVLLAISVVCYAVWRGSEAWLGTADPGRSRVTRVQAGIEGVAYLPFGYAAIAVAFGDNASARQGSHYRGLSADLLGDALGQVGGQAVGAVVVSVGVFFVVQGVRRTFMGHFDFDDMPGWAQHVTRWSGSAGCIGRGVMFTLAGVLITYAAITAEPRQAGGIDAALDVLARQPYGALLLLVAAAGFASFTVFAICEAVWRRA